VGAGGESCQALGEVRVAGDEVGRDLDKAPVGDDGVLAQGDEGAGLGWVGLGLLLLLEEGEVLLDEVLDGLAKLLEGCEADG